MRYTENEMLEKAKKILKDLNPQYFKDEYLKKIVFSKDDDVARPIGKIMPTWTAVIDEPITDSYEFLVISDDTGEPLYRQSKHLVVEVKKNGDGVYVPK